MKNRKKAVEASKEHAYLTVRCSPEQYARYRDLAQRQGYAQLAPFIRKVLNDLTAEQRAA